MKRPSIYCADSAHLRAHPAPHLSDGGAMDCIDMSMWKPGVARRRPFESVIEHALTSVHTSGHVLLPDPVTTPNSRTVLKSTENITSNVSFQPCHDLSSFN